ncbi:MAG: two-component system, OmpR family, phosphate regulon sensor histidine kinase PhoR [Chloroflexota bacterium]|nr:two-component system, OmpR family, phosphate regulon sensor histidine kinase PhoR [Chloroflexota bacterium]
MEPWLIAIGAVIALLVVSIPARRWRRALDRVRTVAGAAPTADPVLAVAAIRDVADRVASELAADRHDRDSLLESLAAGVITIDREMRIVAANVTAHAFLDRPAGSLIGRSVIEAFIDSEVESIARTAIEQGSSLGEVGRSDPDRRRLLVRARRSSAGGAWLVLEDVSELRRLQQIRAEFIDNLSHELRTPLTTVSLLAETLSRDADAVGAAIPPKMRDRIGKIEVETGHLVQMVSELLDLSRIESGGTIGAVDVLDVGQIAAESTERLRLFADRQGVALRVELPAEVPAVQGDEERLGQVFVNLLHNAVKFSPDGGEVTITVRAEEGRIVSSVADHGVGIPRAAQARIFERFYKVDRARVRGETGGTGLGLAIARHIIEQHGGTIWVESTEGAGSTFSFAVPIAPQPA